MNPEKFIILFEDNHLLVLCKPPGLLVQGDRTGDETLLNLAKQYIKEKYAKPGDIFLGLVHRLDRPASGVIVFARTSKAAARLMRQFQQKQTRKIYHCIVSGEVPENGSWQDHIERRDATSYITDGKTNVELNFHRIRSKNNLSLVVVELITGKHHQIRVQFAQRGFPIVGDFRYGSDLQFPNRAIALHAYELSIVHPTLKKILTFRCKPESYWADYVS